MALVHFTQTRQTLIAYLEGELDHHVSQPLREQIDAQILSLTPVRLILDFSGISFMDSCNALPCLLDRQAVHLFPRIMVPVCIIVFAKVLRIL